jgi:transposase
LGSPTLHRWSVVTKPEGFWLHRLVQAHGSTNYVVDSSSIEVNRRKRRAKSDGLDVCELLSLLMRYVHSQREERRG